MWLNGVRQKSAPYFQPKPFSLVLLMPLSIEEK